MSTRQFVWSILFRADNAQAVTAARELKKETADLTGEAKTAAPVTDGNTAATRKNTEAKRDAARAARELEKAEEDARRAVSRATGPQPTSVVPGAATVPGPSGEEIEQIRARYLPLYAAQQAYQKELASISAAEAAGALTKDESAGAILRVQKSYDRATESIRRADAAMAGNNRNIVLQAHEARNLNYQLSDTFQTLMLGMPPMQVFLQQGPQVVDIFGGIGNTLRYLRQQLTATRMLMIGTTAAVLGGAMSWNSYLTSTKAVETAVNGQGRRLGLGAADLDGIALRGAAVGGLSASRGRELAAELANSGQIGADAIEGMLASAKDFAATRGIDANAVGEEFIRLFSDPSKGADELNLTQMISQAEREEIQRMVAQNRRGDAQARMMEAIRPRLVDAGSTQTMLGRFWGGTVRHASNADTFAGSMIDGLFDASSGTTTASALEYSRQALASARAGGGLMSGQARERTIAELEAQIARLEEEQAADEARRAADRSTEFGRPALERADKAPANALILQERAMRDELAAMEQGRQAADLSITQREDLERAITGQTTALYALTNRQEFALAQDRRDLEIATERNPMRRAELAGLQAMVQAAAKGVAVEDQLAAATSARRQVLNDVIAGASNQAAAMIEEAQARERLLALMASGVVSAENADSWLERELAMRPLIAAAARAEGEDKAALQEQIDNLSTGYDALAKARRDAENASDAQATRRRLEDLALEADLIGRTADEQTRARALAAANRRNADLELDPNSADASQRRVDALREAEAEIRLERQRREYDLRTRRADIGYDAAARVAPNPVLRADIEAQREYARVLRETGDASAAAAEADLIRAGAMTEARGAAVDLLRGQDEQLARLRLEAELAGASERTRARTLALYEAELEIRKLGLQANDELAVKYRLHAQLTAEQRLETERLGDAWDRVKDAAESSVDGAIDALLDGDLKGAWNSVLSEITAMYVELAIKNPAKNAIAGTNHATFNDVGGWGGIVSKLFGGDAAVTAGAGLPSSVGTMDVTAASVMIGGAGIESFIGKMTGNAPAMASGIQATASAGSWTGNLGGSGDVQSQIWSFFAAKGLQPHQIAAIMGNVSAESAFNPMAKGDLINGQYTSFGLFQHHKGRADGLLSATGGIGGLGDVNAQLEYVWRELLGSENGVLKRLQASSNVTEATQAFVGYERPQGWSASNPQGAHNWTGRLGAAEAALAKFGETSASATQQVGQFGAGAAQVGTGLEGFGMGLSGLIQNLGSRKGVGGMAASTVLQGLGKWIGLPGFERGGWTGEGASSDVAGVVHAEEYVFDAKATRRIGVKNLEALRRGVLPGYMAGGYVTGGRAVAPTSGSRASGAGPASAPPEVATFNINVSGTGNSEVQQAVNAGIAQAFDLYDREALPGRVKTIVNDRWGG